MEEKHKILLLLNFVLFPLSMITFSVLTFDGIDHHIQYVDPVSPVCPSEGYIHKDKFCYVAECFNDIENCDKIPVTCPLGKTMNKDDQCYTMLQYRDPVEAHCPEGYFHATDVCLPNDVAIDEHEERLISLRCKDGRTLFRHRCFLMSELIEEPCKQEKNKTTKSGGVLDKSGNTCNISNKSEKTFTLAGSCNSNTRNCVENTSDEEQVVLKNKCYKEKRIFVNA